MRVTKLFFVMMLVALATSASGTVTVEETGPQEDANIAVVNRFIEVFETKDLAVFDEILADDYRDNGEATTTQDVKDKLAAYFKAFPEMFVVVKDQFAVGDRVVTRGVWGGTHRSKLMGIKATRKNVNVKFIIIHRVENGKIAEEWDIHDLLGLMEQLH